MVNSHPVVKTGNIFETINEVSHEYKAELVVMGTHGVSGFREFIAGSNAFRVVSDSLCPVLSVQQQTNPELV